MNLYEAAQQVAAANDIPTNYVYAQWLLESDHGRAPLAVKDNNYGGVTSTSGGYMHFDSMEEWADYMTWFLGRFGIQGSRNTEDYVQRLYANEYFTGDENTKANYISTLGALVEELDGGQYDNEPSIEAFGGRGTGSTPAGQEAAPAKTWTEDDGYPSDDLDYSVLTSNHPGDNYTTAIYADENSVGLQPHTMHGLNKIGHYLNDMYGVMTVVTGGAERWTHQGGTHSHHTGDKADIVAQGVTPDTAAGQDLVRYCHENGWSINYEDANSPNAHWDIDFTGSDGRDPQASDNNNAAPQGYTGGFLSAIEPVYAKDTSYAFYGDLNPAQVTFSAPQPQQEHWGYLEGIAKNFWDSSTTTGFADAMQALWGGLAHSSKWWFQQKDPVTKEDVDYVKAALAGDSEAQTHVLLMGRDSEEIRWLVNQKLIDKKRRQLIDDWKERNDGVISKTLMGAAGLTGYLADPLMLIPLGEAAAGIKIIGRLGTAIRDVGKAREIAAVTAKATYELAKTSAPLGGSSIANDYLRQTFGGRNVNYVHDALLAMGAGLALGALGAGSKALLQRGKPLSAKIAAEAEKAETQALMEAADLDPRLIHSETIGKMREAHDPSFGKLVNSPLYSKLEQKGRVIAAPYEKARAIIAEASGKELPKTAKAFYVPNEDYAVLITDHIKNPAQDTERLLAHEIGVHAGLYDTLGGKDYGALMKEVQRLSNKDGHIFNQIRRAHDTYDPEEIFAHAVEEGALPNRLMATLQGMVNKALRREGYTLKATEEDIMNLLKQQAENERSLFRGFHFNEDGTTAFAGVKFSQDNLLNPQLWADYVTLEGEVSKLTQEAIPEGLKSAARFADQGYVGLMLNSPSNTARKYAPLLFRDTRGRGIGHVKALPAEDQKERIIRQLAVPFLKMADERMNWITSTGNRLPTRAKQLAFDRMVLRAYNAKYAGHTAAPLGDIPEQVTRAVEHLHEYRQMQIALGKKSAQDVGAATDDLIDKYWYEVDDELWRVTDNDLRARFLAHYNKPEEAAADLAEYYRTFAKRDIIRAKLERQIDIQNAHIAEKNIQNAKKGLPPIPLKPKNVTARDVEDWLEDAIPAAVQHALYTDLDPIAAQNIGALGHLNFLQKRIPMDTGGVMVMNKGTQNAFEFSFDNNIRNFDLDVIMQKNMQRFAGEIAAKNVFHTPSGLESFLGNVKKELDLATAHGLKNKDVLNEYTKIQRGIAELRGQRPIEDEIGKAGLVARMGMMLSYVKNGANMGFAQLGELGGSIAYGGASQLFGILPSTRRLMQDIKFGKVEAETIREAEMHLFGESLEAQIFKTNFHDRVVRDALTEKGSLLNQGFISASDALQKLSKVTSTLNMLPKMTDSMYRSMRAQTIADSLSWAFGKTFSKIRNPFSKAKLKGAHVSEKEAEAIKANIRKYATCNAEGKVTKLDLDAWYREDPVSYMKYYGMIQTQAERAIVSGTRLGSKNLWKDTNCITRMLLQFKDYNLRAISGQTLRAMTARDLDDGIAAGMSILTNGAAYALKGYATYQAMKAMGMTDKAEAYYERMFNKEQFLRVAAFRSAILGTPLSFGNDIYEAWTGAPTIRTTVDNSNAPQKDRTAAERLGGIVGQMPAVREMFSLPYATYQALERGADERMNKQDFKSILKLLPIPNFIPFTTYMDKFVNQSSYPDKRPRKAKGDRNK